MKSFKKMTAALAAAASLSGLMAPCALMAKEGIPTNDPTVYPPGWMRENDKWYYRNIDGERQKDSWKLVDGDWYHFDADGWMQTGWLQLNGKWYFLNYQGVMKTGWLHVGGTWYYLDGEGIMQTGWLKQGDTWYYLQPSGAMATGWIKVRGNTYYMYGNGTMASSTWVGDKYMGADGAWQKDVKPAKDDTDKPSDKD